MMGSQAVEEADWFLIRLMDEPAALRAAAPDVAERDPARAEALFHAWPPEVVAPQGGWASGFMGARWTEVETIMERLRDEGLVTSREDVNAIAYRAYADATGLPLGAVLHA